MLVLNRKRDEMIMIGDEIVIQVLDSRRGHTCLGITAPKKIPVHRSEVYDLIQSQKKRRKKT